MLVNVVVLKAVDMHKVTKIIRTEEWKKDGKLHVKTYALINDPDHLDDEFQGYGTYKVGDEVESYFSDRWNKPTIKPHKEIE